MAKILAVEFNDQSIKFVEGSRKGKILFISKEDEIDLPAGIICDGMVKDLDSVTGVLRKLLGNSAKHKKTIFLINSISVLIRKIELPYVKNFKETRSMINFKLQEMLPSYFYQYKIMYKTSEIFMSEGVKKSRYIVYGMPLKMYEGYLDISEKLKLNLESFDISSNFMEDILVENTINGKSIKNGIIAFMYAGKFNMSLSIINKGITELFKIAEYDHEYSSSSEQNCNGTMLRCTDELRKYMKYYISSGKDNNIEKIYLFGESYNEELKESLSDIGAEVEIIAEMPGICIESSEIKHDFLEYFNLAASFYTNKKHIDFLTEKKTRQKLQFSAGIAAMSVILIIAAVLSYNFLNYYFKTNLLEVEIASKKLFLNYEDNIFLNKEIENMKKKTVFLEIYVNKAGEIKEKTELDNLISSEMFEKIKDCAPDDTKINSFFAEVNNVELYCESSSLQSTALFVENLRKIEFVDNVNISNVEIEKDRDVSKYAYAVTCYLKGVDYEEK